MKTLGVDLAAATRKTAAAVLEWSGGGAPLAHLALDVGDEEIVRLFGSADMTGIDCAADASAWHAVKACHRQWRSVVFGGVGDGVFTGRFHATGVGQDFLPAGSGEAVDSRYGEPANPSVAIFSPGRTRKISPGCSWSAGTWTSVPSRITVASFAPRFSSAFGAFPVAWRWPPGIPAAGRW